MFNKPEIDFPVTDNTLVSDLKDNLAKAFDLVQRNSDIKIQMSQIYYNRTNIACKFQIDDLFWARQFKPDDGHCKKFSPKWKGPYTVVQCMDGLDYSLKPLKPKGKKITMHRNNLKKYVQRKSLAKSGSEIIMNQDPPIACPTQFKSAGTKTISVERPIETIVVDTGREVCSIEAPIITMKRGRGRPPNLASSKEVPQKTTPIASSTVEPLKRGRGRPCKSVKVINNKSKSRTVRVSNLINARRNPPRLVNKNKVASK
jgi:hypothetical protein